MLFSENVGVYLVKYTFLNYKKIAGKEKIV